MSRYENETTNIIMNVSISEFEDLKKNVDDFFILINGMVVCLMQAGFACLEAGAVRSKNTTNIIIQNFMDIFISALFYWLVGYTLAYDEGNSILGYRKYWAGVGLEDDKRAHWFFQFVFAATSATLISGAVAERCHFVAYIVYSAVVSGLIYPIVCHWAWSDKGWLNRMGYKDFSGCGPVHLLAGTCSLVAAAMIGPRIGRFGSKSKDSDQEISGHSIPLMGLGGMILVAGFLAFNGGTMGQVTNAGDSAVISQIIVNTLLGGTGGSLVVLACNRLGLCGMGGRHWSFLHSLNGGFAGMVSVCAGVNEMGMWASFVSGTIAAPVYLVTHHIILRCKEESEDEHGLQVTLMNIQKMINPPLMQQWFWTGCMLCLHRVQRNVDDPLDTVAIHFGNGIWGMCSASIFSHTGLVYGFSQQAFLLFAFRMVGAAAIIAWSLATSCVLFGSLKYLGVLRVSANQEILGLDVSLHNEPGYPMKAWQSLPHTTLGLDVSLHNEPGYPRKAWQTLPHNTLGDQQIKNAVNEQN